MCLAGRVDDLVDGLHGKVESHEFTSTQVEISLAAVSTCLDDVHWSETSQSSASCNTREAHLGDRCVDDTFLTELVQQTFCNLFGNLSI